MIENINHLFNQITSLYKINPMITGIFSMYSLGILTYLLKDTPYSLFLFCKRQLTTSLTIKNSDPIYYDLLHWISKNKMHSWIRTLSITRTEKYTSSPLNSDIAMGYGKHWFIFGKFLMSFERVVNNSSMTYDINEEIILTAIGRNHQVFNDLFTRIKDTFEKENLLRVSVWSQNSWKVLSRQYIRNMSSVFIGKEQKDLINEHIINFMQNKNWSIEKGVPWRTGILLSGPPGTGKTSLIKAISGMLPSKSLYILSGNLSDRDMRDALASVVEGGVVAIEDIDVSGICTNRDSDDSGNTLSGLLNAIDGPAAGEGRILIATTNNIKSLDPALIREGRFDLKLEIGYLTNETLKSYIKHFYPNAPCIDDWSVKDKITPAKVQTLILSNKHDCIKVLNEVAVKINKNLKTVA